MIALDTLYETTGPIGGPWHVVQIDESKVGKRKYNVRRIVEGFWVLGMFDIGTINCQPVATAFHLEICPNNLRDEETLIQLIQKHVGLETTIFSDQWRSYINLEQYGYNHLTVNHSTNFVYPDTLAHTQAIEANWRPMKYRFYGGGHRKEGLAENLCEFLWRREVEKSGAKPFETLIRDIGRINWP